MIFNCIVPYAIYNWKLYKDKTELLLAQVSDGQLQLGGLFDSIKIDVKQYKDAIESFNELDLSKSFFKDENGKANWDKIAKSIKGCDETALSYFKTLDGGNGTINNQSASVEGLGAYLKNWTDVRLRRHQSNTP